jgi:hypothetical protein
MPQIEARRETLTCGCVVGYNTAGRLIGFRKECETAIGIFAANANRPETREHSAARSAEFDAHIQAGRRGTS